MRWLHESLTGVRSAQCMQLIPTRAVQYVRMSTDMQENSIAIQAEAIAVFAARAGLNIVRSYEDFGRSGLKAAGRAGLQQLIADVRSGSADFGTILIYDVSRWGRFQDADESAYYEYICRSHGVSVEYCAEQFCNDGSLSASILKTLKRVMAGEFSRELSVKVFAGQAKIVSLGCHRGSVAGYGLRRCLIDGVTGQRTTLRDGQRKRLSTDRVVLVPGPTDELRVISGIYRSFVQDKMSLSAIARQLNNQSVKNSSGRAWSDVAIREILTNEKYIGSAQFNKTSRKLGGPSVKNSRSMWIEAIGAYEMVVPTDLFQRAQQQLAFNARAYTDNELLDSLTALWCVTGRLTASTIDADEIAPCVNAYKEHFGGLGAAYERIGYRPAFRSGQSTQFRFAVMSQLVARLRSLGCSVNWTSGSSHICVNEELVIAFIVVSARPSCGKNQWQLRRSAPLKPDITVLARLSDGDLGPREYFLIPSLFLTSKTWLSVSARRLKRASHFRSSTLDPLIALCIQDRIGGANAARA